MSISILRATPEDAAATIDVGMRAFKDDPLSRLTMNLDTATQEQIQQFKEWRTAMGVNRMQGAGKHYFKAVDEATGALVGFVGTYAPEGYNDQDTWQSPIETPGFIRHEAQAEFRARQASAKERWVGERRDVWYVQSMAVSPDYWGRGIGKRLLKRALEEVDAAGQDIYLEASQAATALYRSCGFEELEKMILFGGDFTMTAMMRRQPAR